MLIAQLTDTHIRAMGQLAYGCVDTAGFLAAAVAHLNAMPHQPEAVLITGDLTETGTEEEYAHFCDLVAPLKAPILPIPGNHDDRDTFARMLRPMAPMLPKSGDLSYAMDVGDLRLILIDSMVPGRAHGDIGAERLAWLDRQLSGQPVMPAVVALHHPPFATGIAKMDAHGCQNAEALEAVMLRHPHVLATVCGHIHRTVLTTFAGKAASIAPSPAHAIELSFHPDAPLEFRLEPPGMHLHAWTPGAGSGRLVTHHVPIGTFSGPHPFFEPGGRPVGRPTAGH